ncbi:MAG: sugar phosphate isomerase/epimerase [Clostridiales bacterium]|nr:sugar phosphate isomerase/epimerase [Clostridiales bacterium]
MKTAFSTLGCPQWSWDDILVTAKDLGFNGVEVRGIENELYVPNAKPFLAAGLDATKDRLAKMKLEIPVFTSACYLFDKVNIEANMKEGRDYIDLASKAGVPYVRVLGDRDPNPGTDIDVDFVASKLAELADYAIDKKVALLIETNGVLAESKKMSELMKKTGKENVGVLWDVHHPYRYFGEAVETTYAELKKYIKHVHIKDSILEDGKIKYKMLGYGDIPVEKALALLKADRFEGYVSLEWVKRWCLDLEEPGVVFSQFVNWISDKTA